jgi:putative two-component system response regulator
MTLEPSTGGRILVVDDDYLVGRLLVSILTSAGHAVTHVQDGAAALAAIIDRQPDLLLLDLDMPNLGGFDVCEHVKRDPATRLIPVVIITGRDPQDARVRAWDLGADEFLAKPFQPVEVLARCRALLRAKRLTDELDSAQSVLYAFARAVEAKCPYTLGHSERVTRYAVELAGRAGLSQDEIDVLRRGGLLHDIGKIAIPDAVLNKPGPLTREEYDIVKQHPVHGERIVQPLRSLQNALPLIRWHHERCDGRGYPDGLLGGDIPLAVRILSVADVYDAVSSGRPYRPALPQRRCLELLREDADLGGLDPELVDVFVGSFTDGDVSKRTDRALAQ